MKNPITKQVATVKLKFFKVDIHSISSFICGGNLIPLVRRLSRIFSCDIRSLLMKNKRLLEDIIYVQTPSLAGKGRFILR